MADTIQVTYKVMEDGSLKAIGRDAERAAKGTDKATKSADKYSKKNKGVAQATSNSTKAFSKMTTGIQGGLVPAYATLAANVFALTAVFGTLSRIDAVAKLEQGLEFVGRASGRNLKIVAEGLKEITGNAVSAEQAMRTTAVGISAGFSEGQMRGLAEVAKGASLALGRDMADAMDRLTRGAAKLEPEILDELGIMVRLDDAVAKYAERHNKATSELTQFERRQAFTNAILEDGKKKFQDITDAIDPSAYSKLAAAFQDLTKTVIGGLNTALNPLIDFFSGAPAALAGVAAVFGGGMVSQLIGGLQGIASGAAEAAQRTEDHAKAALKSIKPHEKMGKAFNEVAKSGDRGDKALKRMLKSVNMTINMTSKDTQKLKVATKARNALTKEIFRQELAETKHRLASTLGTLQTYGAAEAFRHLGRELSLLRTQTLAAASGQSFFNKVLIFGQGAATAFAATIRLVGAAFLSFLPYIGLAVTAFTLLMPYFKKPEDKLDKVLKKNSERLEEFKKVVDQFEKSMKSADTASAAFVLTLKAMAGLKTEAEDAIRDIIDKTSFTGKDYDTLVTEGQIKRNKELIERLKGQAEEYRRVAAGGFSDEEIAEGADPTKGTESGRYQKLSIIKTLKDRDDLTIFKPADLVEVNKQISQLEGNVSDLQGKLDEMEEYDPLKAFKERGVPGIINTVSVLEASMERMKVKLVNDAADTGRDTSEGIAVLDKSLKELRGSVATFMDNPTPEAAENLANDIQALRERSDNAVKSMDDFSNIISNVRKELDENSTTLGKYGGAIDDITAGINSFTAVANAGQGKNSKAEEMARSLAEALGITKDPAFKMAEKMLESMGEAQVATAKLSQNAVKAYLKRLKEVNTELLKQAEARRKFALEDLTGMKLSIAQLSEREDLERQAMETKVKELSLIDDLHKRNKVEQELNDILKERLGLNSKKTDKLVDNAKASGMGAATVGVIKGVGAKENIDMTAQAAAEKARRDAEQKARDLEEKGDTTGAAAARAAGETEAGAIDAAAQDAKAQASAQAARESMKGIADDLRAISPENELLASTIEGISNMGTAWQTAMEVMKSDSASMTDKVQAGLGALGATISALGQMQKAASEQRVRAIDSEIKAEQNRDGKSAASQQKIAALEKKKEAEKRKQFEKDKKMKIAQTIIGGLQGAISAYTSLSIIPIVGPALGAAAAAAILSMTADNVAAIKATQYSGGGGVGGVSKISAGDGRSNSVDLATANNAAGEQAYMRGAEGQGKMGNFKPAFAGYKHRQAGGYVVGEQGPELFMPEESGEIIPAGKQPGATTNVNFSINAVDATGVQELLEVQKGNIIAMIRQAAHDHGEDFLEMVKEDSL